MAESFKNRVDALTGFGSTDDSPLNDWLTDGVREIVNVLPDEFLQYCADSTPLNSSTGLNLGTDTDIGGGDTGITNFPDSADYLIVLYAAIKAIHALMNDKNAALSDLSLSPVPPDVPSIGTSSVTFSTTAPAYSGGSVVGFGSLLKTLANLSVSAVPPDTPTINTVSYTDFTNVSLSGETFSTTEVSFSQAVPSHTPPNITAASGTQPLTEMEAITSGQVGNDADFIDFEMWFSALGEMI